jgi:glyoxalase-like protein
MFAFDHFIILVEDLAAAMRSFQRLGFEVRAGGEHPAFGSHNALIALADGSYFELVAFKDPALAARSFWAEAHKKLKAGEGFGGFALASDDLSHDVSRIRAGGISITDPQPGARTRLDGRGIAWRTALIGNTPSGVMPFLIQDETAHSLRVERPTSGLGSRTRAIAVLVAAHQPESVCRDYLSLLGSGRRSLPDTDVTLPWGRIVIAGPETGGVLAEHLERRGEGLFEVTLAADDVAHERREAVARGLTVIEDGPQGVMFARELACGARIRLVQRGTT